MKTIQIAATLAALSLSALAFGCSSNSGDGVGTTSAAGALSVKAEKIVGTWENNGANSLPFYVFTFNADESYTAQGGCRPNPNGPQCFAITGSQGTWKLAKSGPELGAPAGAETLVLDDQLGQETSYFYTVTDTSLTLSTALVGGASVFEKQGAAANQCQAASDCSGLLPQFCQVCADGTSSCAHWDCNQGQCAVATCENDGGPATVDAGASAADAGAPTANDAGPACNFPVTCVDGTSGCADTPTDPCASHGGECSAAGNSCVTDFDCCPNLACDNNSANPTFDCIAK